MRDTRGLPMADPGREADARRLFPMDVTPEEYAARYGHDWHCFSMDDYRYADARLEAWIHRLGDILFEREGAPRIDDLRRQYLTDEERRAIEARAREEL
jgi:hypothetical protein